MKKRYNLLGFILAVVVGVALLAVLIMNAFFPNLILPKPSAAWIIILSLVALVIDYYFAHGCKHDLRLVPIYGAVIFGLFPMAAFVAAPMDCLMLALLGAVILTVLAFLFDSIIERLSSGPAAKAAPIISAFGLYLAAQCLIGIIN